MTRFVLRRLLSSAVLLVVVSFIIFSFIYIAPGDPVTVLLGGHDVTPEQVQAVRDQYHLDDPFIAQYA